MQLQHCHKHPLIFNEELINGDREYLCKGCRKRVSGPNYSCKECFEFVLHQSCAELPCELEHPVHPKHPLTLMERMSEDKWPPDKCDGRISEYCLGFAYHCAPCNFNLDITCPFLPLTIKAEIHDHPLTLLRRLFPFTCDACGKGGECMSYFCLSCSFVVHIKCSSLPSSVKAIRHEHPLTFTYSLPANHPGHKLCGLCVRKVDSNYKVYYCSKCHFVAHLECAMVDKVRDETFVQILGDKDLIRSTSIVKYEDPELDEAIGSSSYIIQKIDELGVEIKHSSHKHDLKLVDELEINEKCDGCMQPIHPPFYSCDKCRFFLHESCAELPRTMRHFLHKHPLILVSTRPGECFRCDACKRACSGFTYKCNVCNFKLDVLCSSVGDTLKDERHEHQLVFSSSSSEKCSSCGSENEIFRCADDCGFTLDFKCTTLPNTVRYRPYEDSFELIRSTVEEGSDEYYCDICEKQRDPKHWYYYCEELEFPAHPECIMGNFPYIKTETTTCTTERHRHPVTRVQTTKDRPTCNVCPFRGIKLDFECRRCNLNIHQWYVDI